MYKPVIGVVLLFVAHAAWAADQPHYEPPPAWVDVREIPKPGAGDDGATQVLLEDIQDKFGSDGLDSYYEIVERIQTPQGLSNLGNISFDWNPDTQNLLIHRLRVIRGGQTIDLLASGQKFIVLRRENKLDYAMLDGTLTAAIQPEGLQVGDILDLAIGYQNRDPIARGRSGRVTELPLSPTGRFTIREIWPTSETPRWRETAGLDKPKISTTPLGTELVIDMTNVIRPKGPKYAPNRYAETGRFEISELSDWSQVSALMGPLYEKAAQLKPDSPLRAEVARIKAASNDPKIRAAAALRLVQDQVRYLFLGMNNGGYLPVDADISWSRRFGDCKGKTVLLLALLHELGIKAEPALVDVESGDGLDVRTPIIGAFDHVLVRAEIDGKIYWIDGTRSADRNLDDLAVPNFGWALPLRAVGASLERLVVPPFVESQELIHLHLDASAGLDPLAPAHADLILRGDRAVDEKLKIANMRQSEVETYLRDYWRDEYDWIDIEKVDAAYDEKTGEEHLSMDGLARMEWKGGSSALGRRYETDGALLGWRADYSRDPGPDQDAPFTVRYPYFDKSVETIILPDHGVGFTFEGDLVDKVIAGREFKRTAEIRDGIFTMEASTRAIVPEFPAADAPAAQKDLRALRDVTIYLRAPREFVVDAKTSTKVPTTADGFVARGYQFYASGDRDRAIADFGQAILLKPDLGSAFAARAIVYLAQMKLDRATADVSKAIEFAPNDVTTIIAEGYLQLAKRQFSEAVKTFTRVLELSHDNSAAYEMRGTAYQGLGDSDKALSDFATTLRLAPDRAEIYGHRAELFFTRNEGELALSEADKYLAARPKDLAAHSIRANALMLLGRNAEAVKEFDIAITGEPTALLYLARAQARDEGMRQLKLEDIGKAQHLAPGWSEPYLLRAEIYAGANDLRAAIKALDDGAKAIPKNLEIVRRRQQFLERDHQYDRAADDIGLLYSKAPEDTELLIDRCRDRALSNQGAQKALADCDLAIKINPDIDEAFTARALVYLRLGQFDKAIADYTVFLKRRPNSPIAHFGRGIAELRQHATADGQLDIALARKYNPNIDAVFAGYPRPASWYGLTQQAMANVAIPYTPMTTGELVTRASGLIDRSEFDAAIADLNRAIDIDPKSSEAFGDQGIAHFWKGEIAEATADFDKALALNPAAVVALRGRALVLARNDNPKQAIEYFTQSIALEPKNAFTYDHRARAYASLASYDKALADFDTVLRLNPSLTNIYADRSNLFLLMHDGARALADADRVVAANNDNPQGHRLRAAALKLLGRRQDVDAELDRLVVLSPTAQSYLDRAQFRFDDPEKNRSDIERAIALDPKSTAAFVARAKWFSASGDLKHAIADADQAVALSPDNRQALGLRIYLLTRDHQYDVALQASDKLLGKMPNDAQALNNRCWLRAIWGQDFPTALADCNASLNISPSAMTEDSRGFVYLRLGRFDDAIADYNAALKTRPTQASSLFGRGLAKLRQGKTDEGQADLAAARAADAKIDTQFADYGVKP